MSPRSGLGIILPEDFQFLGKDIPSYGFVESTNLPTDRFMPE
jgi:hypothetical protein